MLESIITPFGAMKYVFDNMKNGAFAPKSKCSISQNIRANAPFPIIFSKVFKT